MRYCHIKKRWNINQFELVLIFKKFKMFRPKLTYDINYFNEYNKNRINRDDIETLHKCNDCGKNNKLYWSEQKRPN